MSRLGTLLLGSIALLFMTSTTYASDQADIKAFAQAKTSLSQAINTAETHTKGKAIQAEFDHSRKHGWIYDVEVISNSKLFDVAIDPATGAVISVTEDKKGSSRHHTVKP